MLASSRSSRESGVRKSQNKTSSACLTCRKKKVKCSGTVPCEYCRKRGLDCSVPHRQERRVYSVTHVEDLENRLAQYEGRSQVVGEWLPDAAEGPPRCPSVPSNDAQQPEGISVAAPSPASRHSTRVTTSKPLTAIETDSSLSSSATFGFRVQSLLNHTRHGRETPGHTPTAPTSSNIEQSPGQASISHRGDLGLLPSESEAYRLLDVVSLYIGQSQSHFDFREVSDNIELYYADPETQLGSRFLRMGIIFAVGKLLSGDDADNNGDAYPGSGLFEVVHARLPRPSEQYAQGRVAIETLTLLGVYLQNMNRKEEAYIYTSIALRLAVMHGYHRRLEARRVLRWEKAHIGRLWWTIYMQERRLAAATGHPYGIEDSLIELEYPVDQPGFSPSQPIRTNARIARITSRILIGIFSMTNSLMTLADWAYKDLYSPKRQSQDSFVLNVKEIIKCLHDISREIPENLETVAHGPNANVSVRTTASLQLMLYQATLLTIRPVMLHVAHFILAGESSGLEQLGNSSLAQLCRACAEAARRIVRTILTLRRMNLLAIVGFFDCDAIFSAAFVLILTVVFDSACKDKDKINPSPGLGEALECLQYLADNHSTNAMERLYEVQNIWNHLSELLRVDERTATPHRECGESAHDSAHELADDGRQVPIVHNNTQRLNDFDVTNDARQLVPDANQPSQLGPRLNSVGQGDVGMVLDAEHFMPGFQNDMPQIWLPLTANAGTVPADDLLPSDIPLDEYYGYFQSLLDNSDWYLTGQDVGDLAEFGRHIASFSRS